MSGSSRKRYQNPNIGPQWRLNAIQWFAFLRNEFERELRLRTGYPFCYTEFILRIIHVIGTFTRMHLDLPTTNKFIPVPENGHST